MCEYAVPIAIGNRCADVGKASAHFCFQKLLNEAITLIGM
jgi:hypothetical protein